MNPLKRFGVDEESFKKHMLFACYLSAMVGVGSLVIAILMHRHQNRIKHFAGHYHEYRDWEEAKAEIGKFLDGMKNEEERKKFFDSSPRITNGEAIKLSKLKFDDISEDTFKDMPGILTCPKCDKYLIASEEDIDWELESSEGESGYWYGNTEQECPYCSQEIVVNWHGHGGRDEQPDFDIMLNDSWAKDEKHFDATSGKFPLPPSSAGGYSTMQGFWNSLAPEEREQYLAGLISREEVGEIVELMAQVPWDKLPSELKDMLRMNIMPLAKFDTDDEEMKPNEGKRCDRCLGELTDTERANNAITSAGWGNTLFYHCVKCRKAIELNYRMELQHAIELGDERLIRRMQKREPKYLRSV